MKDLTDYFCPSHSMAGRGGNVGHYIFIITYVCMYICYGESGGRSLVRLYSKTLGAAAETYERVADNNEKMWRRASVWRRVKVRCT